MLLCTLCRSQIVVDDQKEYIFDKCALVELSIAKVLRLHFAWLKDYSIGESMLCSICLDKLKSFHVFYQSVLDVHESNLNISYEIVKQTQPICSLDKVQIELMEEEDGPCSINSESSLADSTKDVYIETKPNVISLAEKSLCVSTENLTCINNKRKTSGETKIYASSFECPSCDKRFSKKHLLTHHQQMTHTTYEHKKFECFICKRRYVFKSFLQNHMRTHEELPTHICDVCAKSFKSAKSYENHYHVEHSNSMQRAQCMQCGKWLKHILSLKRHMAAHTNVKQTCDICGHVSPGKRALQVHVRTMHEAPKHKCLVCDKLFRKSSNLKEHMAIHQNINDLYKCPWCPMTCRSSANMSKHRTRVHLAEHLADKAIPVPKTR